MVAFRISTDYRSRCYLIISIVIFLICFDIPVLIGYKF
nr:MAG TPA: rich Immunoreceptor tyrosine-based activation motif [Caudoviricetes sp.]